MIPAVAPLRRPLHIDPSINTEDLFTERKINGDVIVFSEANDEGDQRPKMYYLQRITNADA